MTDVTRAWLRGVLLAAGLIIRLVALPLPGTLDMEVWKIWSVNASRDVTAVYGIGGTPPARAVLEYGTEYTTVDYPPVALYEMALVGRAYSRYEPAYPNTRALNAAVKLPMLLNDIALTWVLFVAARSVSGSFNRAWFAALAYWLNPAVVLNGAILGYLDPLLMFPAVAGLVLAGRDWPVAGGAAAAVALLCKPQGILVIPAVVLAAWRHGRGSAIARATLGAAVAAGAILLPFLARGALPNLLLAAGSFAHRDILSGHAANIWWIVNYVSRAWLLVPDLGFPQAFLVPVPRVLAISSFMDLGFPNPRPFASVAVVAAVAWAAWRVHHARDLATHAALAAFSVYAYFVMAVGVHENHLMLAIPLLALATALDDRYRGIFVVASVACAFGMNVFYGLGRGVGWAVPRMSTLVDLSVVISLVNVATLVWFGRVLTKGSGRRGTLSSRLLMG